MSDAETPQYGLPTPRSNDGEREPVEFTFDWNGQSVTIVAIEPTVAELNRYENLGEEASFETLYDIVDDHLVQPEIGSMDDLTGSELICYLTGIKQLGVMGGTDLAQDVNEALSEREATPGN